MYSFSLLYQQSNNNSGDHAVKCTFLGVSFFLSARLVVKTCGTFITDTIYRTVKLECLLDRQRAFGRCGIGNQSGQLCTYALLQLIFQLIF